MITSEYYEKAYMFHMYKLIFRILAFFDLVKKPSINWAPLPSVSFTAGSPLTELQRNNNNETQIELKLPSFKISKYAITVGQYKEFVDATGYVTDAEKGKGHLTGSEVWINSTWETKTEVNWKHDENGNLRALSEYNHPVIHVSWNDAVAFADYLGCRLPDELEWEYACRAGTITTYNTGEVLTTDQANFDGSKYPYNNNPKGEFRKRIMPVGSFNPNSWGIFEMHGNVDEWCSNKYRVLENERWIYKEDYGYINMPSSSEPSRVYRGGSWLSTGQECRSASRYSISPFYRSSIMGFRIVSPLGSMENSVALITYGVFLIIIGSLFLTPFLHNFSYTPLFFPFDLTGLIIIIFSSFWLKVKMSKQTRKRLILGTFTLITVLIYYFQTKIPFAIVMNIFLAIMFSIGLRLTIKTKHNFYL